MTANRWRIAALLVGVAIGLFLSTIVT